MDHDHSYKLLFSHPEMVADLLRGFVHEPWVGGLDFASLEKVSGSYVTDDLREREDDIIWRVRWGQDWLYVYLLQEFQSTVFRLEGSRTPQDVGQVLAALVEWLKSPEQTALRRAFTVWLKRVFLPGRVPGVEFSNLNDLQEVQSMLAERVIEWTEEWKRQGVEKGRQEGEAILLLRMLELRFGPLSEGNRAKVRAADADTLLRWGERMLTAATAEEVFTG